MWLWTRNNKNNRNNEKIKVKFRKLISEMDELRKNDFEYIPITENSIMIPTYKSDGAAGADLYSCHRIGIKPNKRRLVHTGIAIELPEGYEAQVRTRSSYALKHGVFVLNSPGTIDSDYRGEIGVILFNTSDRPFWVDRGDRIAQLIITPVVQATFEEVENLNNTKRGSGGFGSTGKR